jgi:hypothetical protein
MSIYLFSAVYILGVMINRASGQIFFHLLLSTSSMPEQNAKEIDDIINLRSLTLSDNTLRILTTKMQASNLAGFEE